MKRRSLGEPVVDTTITKVAMDTHKKQHTVAWVNCETGETETVTVKNNSKDIKKMVRKLKLMSIVLKDSMFPKTIRPEIFKILSISKSQKYF